MYEQNQIKQAAAEKEKIHEQLQIALLSPEEREKFKTQPQEEKEAFYSNIADYVAAVAKEKLVTEKWGIGGSNSRALNAVTMAITGALGGQTDLQVATNSLSPYAAQLIGEQWGHGEDKNTAAQLTAHAILGATLAYVNGANPAVGGSAAVAAESAADYLSKPYKDNPDYQNANGEFEANRLPEDIKTQIRDLTSAIGAVVGGTVGDSAFNAQLVGVVGQNAVENNYLAGTGKNGEKYFTDNYNKYNILQYQVANGLLSPEQVPNSVFDNLVDDNIIYTDIENTTYEKSTAENYKKSFFNSAFNGDIISTEEYEALKNTHPELFKENESEIFRKKILDEAKSGFYQYGVPAIQMVGGGRQLAGAGLVDVVGCSTVIACGVAIGGGSLLIANGADDIRTGWKNFGTIEQTNSYILMQIYGVSEENAAWIKLGTGAASGAAEMRQLYLQVNKEILKNQALTANAINASSLNRAPDGNNQQIITNNFNAENNSLTEMFNYGQTITFDPSKISFSQATVSFEKNGKAYNYETMVDSMREKGWNGDPVDVVIMPNGTATSMDNTRILAAREAGIDVQARVRDYNSPLTNQEKDRFTSNNVIPNTWGEAIKLRVEKQATQKGISTGWSIQFPYGSLYDPKIVKGK